MALLNRQIATVNFQWCTCEDNFYLIEVIIALSRVIGHMQTMKIEDEWRK